MYRYSVIEQHNGDKVKVSDRLDDVSLKWRAVPN